MRTGIRLAILISVGALILASSLLFQATPPMKLGTNLWPGYEPLYVGREIGVLQENEVALVELLSASEVMRAFRNGAIDAAALTLDEVINLRVMGLEPVIVQVTNFSMGADVILARPGIVTLNDLRGKRVGVEATALGAYMLSRALEIHEMELADIKVVHLEVNEHVQAFQEGKVDALVTFDPVPQQIGPDQAVRLFDSSVIPGEIVDVLVVRKSVLEKRHKQVRYLINAWHQALAFIETQPARSARLMASRLKLPPADVEQSLGGLRLPGHQESIELFSGDVAPLQKQAERLADIMRANHLIDEVPDLSGLVYRRYPES